MSIFLVKFKEDAYGDLDKEHIEQEYPLVELSPEELELLKICLENNKADFEHEGCLPSHKVMFDRIEALLKKLSKVSE